MISYSHEDRGIPIRSLEEFLRELPHKINNLSIVEPLESAVYEDGCGRWDTLPEHTFFTESETEYSRAMRKLCDSGIWPGALQTLESEVAHANKAKSLGYGVLYLLMFSRDQDSAHTGVFYICGGTQIKFEASRKSLRQKLMDERAIILAPRKQSKNDLLKLRSINRELENMGASVGGET